MATVIGEWTRGPAIGRGSSATVSLAVDRRTGAVFAVKSVDAARAGELRREQSILQGLASPNVVQCLGMSVSGRDLFLEYAPGGSLADEIRRRGGRCEERVIRSRARDVLRGLAHAHAAGVAHCDVKARNVLIGADGRAMIADLGCARRVRGGGGITGDHGDKQLRGGGGTPMFMAPEAARGEEQGTAADIWALGCTVVEMATGGAPWPRFADPMGALRHVAISGEVPECPRWLSEDARDFLARCFRRDPRERWTAEQLLEHQFVATAADSSNSVPIVAEKEPFVSPKSVLDQALWDDSTASATTTAPTDRVRELAAEAPQWTWDANWITVHSDDDVRSTSPEPELEANASGHSVAAGSTSHGNSYGDDATSSCCSGKSTDDSFCGGDHVISNCINNLAIASNGFFRLIPIKIFVFPFPRAWSRDWQLGRWTGRTVRERASGGNRPSYGSISGMAHVWHALFLSPNKTASLKSLLLSAKRGATARMHMQLQHSAFAHVPHVAVVSLSRRYYVDKYSYLRELRRVVVVGESRLFSQAKGR